MRSIPKFFAIRTALAMLTMSWGLTRTRIGGSARPPSCLAEEGDIVPLRLERRGEPGLLDGFYVGFLGLHELGLHQLHQRIVESDHPRLTTGLQDRGDLEGLALPDEVRDGRRAQQDLAGGDPPSADLAAQGLSDDAPERFREHDPH